MKTRRDFIKTTGIASLILPIQACAQASSEQNTTTNKAVKPIIISTWKHGLQANEVGYEILKKGGSAIDAVEKGVVVVENDPTNQTVGLGGFPDRDGNVTLDACIMKGDGACGSVAFLQEIKNPISVARKGNGRNPSYYVGWLRSS